MLMTSYQPVLLSPQPLSEVANMSEEYFTLEWFQNLSHDELVEIARLELLNTTNGLPSRTRALLDALAERLEDKK